MRGCLCGPYFKIFCIHQLPLSLCRKRFNKEVIGERFKATKAGSAPPRSQNSGGGRPSRLALLPHSLSFIFRSCGTERDPRNCCPPGFTGEEGTPRSERCKVWTWPPDPEQAARKDKLGAGVLPADSPCCDSHDLNPEDLQRRIRDPARWLRGTAERRAAPPSRRGSHGDRSSDPAELQAAVLELGREAPPGVRVGGPRSPRSPLSPPGSACPAGVLFRREMRPEIRTGEALRLRCAPASSSVLDRMNHNVKKIDYLTARLVFGCWLHL